MFDSLTIIFGMALSRWGDGGADKQPYNIILAGAFGVGKSSLFRQLSTEVDGDYLYTTLPATVNLKQQTRPAATATTVPSSSRYLDKWTHSALVLGDTVQVRDL